MLFISMLVLEKFLEGSNGLFYPPGYTLFVTLQRLAYFSQLTLERPRFFPSRKTICTGQLTFLRLKALEDL